MTQISFHWPAQSKDKTGKLWLRRDCLSTDNLPWADIQRNL